MILSERHNWWLSLLRKLSLATSFSRSNILLSTLFSNTQILFFPQGEISSFTTIQNNRVRKKNQERPYAIIRTFKYIIMHDVRVCICHAKDSFAKNNTTKTRYSYRLAWIYQLVVTVSSCEFIINVIKWPIKITNSMEPDNFQTTFSCARVM
jgi:hypothetical protein